MSDIRPPAPAKTTECVEQDWGLDPEVTADEGWLESRSTEII